MGRSLEIKEPWDGLDWDGRVLKDHRAMGWLVWKGPYRSQSHGMVGLDGSLQITEPWDGLVWKCPYRSQNDGMGWFGLAQKSPLRSPQIEFCWLGRVFTDHQTTGWVRLEGS